MAYVAENGVVNCVDVSYGGLRQVVAAFKMVWAFVFGLESWR